MSFAEEIRPLLAARAATDPDAARLLAMFTRADQIVRGTSQEQIGDSETAKVSCTPTRDGYHTGR